MVNLIHQFPHAPPSYSSAQKQSTRPISGAPPIIRIVDYSMVRPLFNMFEKHGKEEKSSRGRTTSREWFAKSGRKKKKKKKKGRN